MKFFNIITDKLARKTAALLVVLPIALSIGGGVAAAGPDESGEHGRRFQSLEEAVAAGVLDAKVAEDIQADGTAEAIVGFSVTTILNEAEASTPKGNGHGDAVLAKVKPRFASIKGRALGLARDAEVIQDYDAVGSTFARFRSPGGLLAVLNSGDVQSVQANELDASQLTESLPLIQQPQAAASGWRGAGTSVAVLDTGVDFTRAAFGSCTAPGVPASCLVPFAQDFAPSDGLRDANGHGTNVAGIVLGVAPSSRILALDVFNGAGAARADQIAALTWVVNNATAFNIKAVNMSLGDSAQNSSQCSSDSRKPSFDSLRAAGIIPVVSSGNNGFKNGVTAPACVPGALSVGAVHDSAYGSYPPPGFLSSCTDATTAADQVTCFSNSGPTLSIFAPGAMIRAAGLTYAGTSQAAPHVAGAVAVLAAKERSATANEIQNALVNSGPQVTDRRDADATNDITRRRLDLNAAAQALVDRTPPVPTAPWQAFTTGAILNADNGVPAKGMPTRIQWYATDASGIARYEVQRLVVNLSGSTWTSVIIPTLTSTSFTPFLSPDTSNQYRIRAVDTRGNVSVWATGSTFTTRLSQESAATYTGTWSTSSSCLVSGCADRWSNAANASASFTFTGRSVAWVATKGANMGRAQVYLDGVLNRTVDLYSTTNAYRTVVFNGFWSTPGTHTIRIVVEGTAGHPTAPVDAFMILQ